MKTIWMIACVAVVTGCSSGSSKSSSDGNDGLDGSWVYTNSANTAGLGALFNTDGTYALTELVLTSSTAANAQEETGTFTVSGDTITETPTKSTCDGPAPVHQLTYSISNGDLTLKDPSAVVVLQPNTSTSSNVAIVLGCFDSNGNFKAQPLASVSN